MEEETTHWGGRIKTIVQRDKVHAKRLKLSHKDEQVPQRPTEPIEFGNGYGIDPTLSAVGQKPVECVAAILRAGHSVVDVLRSDRETSGLGVRAQPMKLGLDVLLDEVPKPIRAPTV